MRVIQTYTFRLGSKIPYSEYPSIAKQFLAQHNLVSHRFLYYFGELFHSVETSPYLPSPEEVLANGSCTKARKDCPKLGETRCFLGNAYKLYDELFLTNIDGDTGCTEDDILPHMNKYHRRYGFTECNLYYYDINFFDHVIPYERDLSAAKICAARVQKDLDESVNMSYQPYGSGIRLHRYCVGGNFISLSIDLLHNGAIYDATPYFNTMKALLPHVHPETDMKIYLSDEEKCNIESWKPLIQPYLKKARVFFAERFPGKKQQNQLLSEYKLVSKLKKLGKKHGFAYRYESIGLYILEKRTPRGHVLQVCVDSGPSHYDTTYHVVLQGLGFCHKLCCSMQCPNNQAEFEDSADKMFSVLSEFEETLLPELDQFYEETPDWFVPSTRNSYDRSPLETQVD